MIITIARQCGCEGDEVGRKLSEIYGIPCYSKKELIELAKEKKVYDWLAEGEAEIRRKFSRQ